MIIFSNDYTCYFNATRTKPECSQVFHICIRCIVALSPYKGKLATELHWWHILQQIFINIIFIPFCHLRGVVRPGYPKCTIQSLVRYITEKILVKCMRYSDWGYICHDISVGKETLCPYPSRGWDVPISNSSTEQSSAEVMVRMGRGLSNWS